jgi:hypothetical protein
MSLPQLTPARRAKVARWLAVLSIIGWPVTQATVARDEPPFTLGLSWLAIILTFTDLAASTDVRDHMEGDTT